MYIVGHNGFFKRGFKTVSTGIGVGGRRFSGGFSVVGGAEKCSADHSCRTQYAGGSGAIFPIRGYSVQSPGDMFFNATGSRHLQGCRRSGTCDKSGICRKGNAAHPRATSVWRNRFPFRFINAKRLLKIGCVISLLLSVFSFAVAAEQPQASYVEEQLAESGAGALWENLDEQTKQLYENIGVDSLSELGDSTLSLETLFHSAGDILQTEGMGVFAAFGCILACIVLCAYVGGLKETVKDGGVRNLYETVCVLSVCGVVIFPFVQCIRAVQQAMSGAAVFMGSFSPVYIAVLASGGQLKTALSYQSVVLLFSQLLTWLAGGVLLPILLMGFSMGIVSCTTNTANLAKVGETALKAVGWTVGIAAAVFTTLLTVNNMLGMAGDTLSSRMMKLSLASFVPVVGGALSEAFLTVKSCIGVVKTTVGAFGMVTTALLVLPSLLQCVCWQTCFWLAGMAADTFEQTALSSFLKTAQQVTKTMIALLLVCSLFMIIGTAIVSRGEVL